MEALIVLAVAGLAAVAVWAVRGRTHTQPFASVVDTTRRGPPTAVGGGGMSSAGSAPETAAASTATVDTRERDDVLRKEERILQREQSLEARIAADEDPAQPARAREVVHPFLLARAAST